MDTVDISGIFPLKNDAKLSEFLKIDEHWNERKKGRVIIFLFLNSVII